ncbi:MAG: YggS family pyridoxal phosphate-dependent enzyme [Boseongicola sp.]|nr:YggS family pyridoxal phosphate-dependent enzyme [Boseongicola sp.]
MSLSETRTRIARAADAHGRDVADISLIAVSKLQPTDRIEAVLGQGHRAFGENRLQEAQGRWPAFRERFPDVELHLVGALQTNKARDAVALFDAIPGGDRLKLPTTIARIAGETGSCPDLFVQVNTGNEPQKAGVAVEEADELVAGCRALELPLKGLMCLPPVDEPPSLHFALLKKIADRNDLPGLSMGMSGDVEEAIAQGATHVRVGSAVFGARERG